MGKKVVDLEEGFDADDASILMKYEFHHHPFCSIYMSQDDDEIIDKMIEKAGVVNQKSGR